MEQESDKAKTLGHSLWSLQSTVQFLHIRPHTTPRHLPFHLWWESVEEAEGSCHPRQVPLALAPLWCGHHWPCTLNPNT